MNHEKTEQAQFTQRGQIDKAIHTLEGLLKGIAIDGKINKKENEAITNWIESNINIAKHQPFIGIVEAIQFAFEDGFFTEDEKEDLIWLCNNFTTDNEYYKTVTSDIQRLQGMMAGIAADGIIEKGELLKLEEWLDEHDELTGCWPYDEIASLIVEVLKDGIIDLEEHAALIQYFKEFQSHFDESILDPSIELKTMTVGGICAVNPDIEFQDKHFILTGKSSKATRKELEKIIKNAGGFINFKSVTKETNYLIVGNDGNQCWAFSTYGRKVESAIELRKQGFKMMIIQENDFWDAVKNL